jgi:hypothetical protein
MAKVKNGSSAEIEQTIENQVVAPEVTPAPEVNKPLTRDELQAAFVSAKLKLRAAEDANDFNTSHPDVKAAELEQFNAKKALKDFDDAEAKEKLKLEMNEKMTNAKAVLMEYTSLTEERINEILASTDVAKSLKWAFNFVFGTPERIVKPGATGASLTKSSQTEKSAGNGEANVNDVVGELFNRGLTHDEILNMGHSEGRIRNVAYKLDYAKDKLTGVYTKRAR